jgi:predicted metal-binding transcription factor (methanogenesis marker protein 9)
METKDTKIEDNDLEQTEMTDEQFNAFLEQLAKLVETNATTGKEAAKIIRQAKV